MLRKLLKYEYQATRRVFFPFYITILFISLLMGFTNSELFETNLNERMLSPSFFNILWILISISFFGLAVMTFVMVVKRFDQNLLSDEGYLMFTLPVRTSQLIWSKMLISLFWILLSSIIFLFSMFLIFRQYLYMHDMLDKIRMAFQDTNFIQFLLYIFLTFVLSYCIFLLMIYSSLSISQAYSITKSRVVGATFVFIGLSVLFYFMRIAFTFAVSFIVDDTVDWYTYFFPWDYFTLLHPITLLLIGYSFLKIIFLYFLTRHHLVYKLNLD